MRRVGAQQLAECYGGVMRWRRIESKIEALYPSEQSGKAPSTRNAIA
jgi:hypothetical protein